LLHFPLQFSVDEFWRRFREVGPVFWSFFVWRKEGCVEDIVDLPLRWEFYMVGSMGDGCSDKEWSIAFGGQFGGRVCGGEILGV